MDALSSYPFIVIRVGCSLCPRSGSYRLARLAAKYGAEIPLDELLDRLARDCRWRRETGEGPAGKYDPKCGARFVDLDAPRPPDLPPALAGLRVIRGGKG
jgi:hypothetical protein